MADRGPPNPHPGEHRVPLCKAVMAILRECQPLTNGHGFIFPGMRPKKPLSNTAMAKVLERMGRDDITVHGFRSTFRDWVEETTNYAGPRHADYAHDRLSRSVVTGVRPLTCAQKGLRQP
jgi:integrase